MNVCHFNKVDSNNIVADFTDDGLHRSSLTIPLLGRGDGKNLCVIGQNPSAANEEFADKTVHYVERYVFENLPQYSTIIMLNLYSRVDTKKEFTDDLRREETNKKFRKILDENTDYLAVFGRLKNKGSYKFIHRGKEVQELLKGKRVFKIDIGSDYAPHPGNFKILYWNYCHGITHYDFSDI